MDIYARLAKMLEQGEGAWMRSEYSAAGVTRALFTDGALKSPGIEYGADGVSGTLTEYFAPHLRLIILGGGHVALPLAKIAETAGFSVTVFDDRPEFANTERFACASEVICDGFDKVAQRLNITRRDYVAVITRGHRYDAACLRAILKGETPFYLGMIGSRRKVAATRETLLEEGADPEVLSRLHAPIGLDIGAKTPEEIAVSIVAELICQRRQKSGDELTRVSDCDLDVIRWLAKNPGTPGALATVISVKGSAPRGVGARMAVLPHGKIIGTIGGGCAEADIRRSALDVIGTKGCGVHCVDLMGTAEQDGMVCGGVMEVLIEDLVYSLTG